MAASLFAGYEALKVRTIDVMGLKQRSPVDVIALSGISYGDFVLRIDKKEAVTLIEQDPYFKVVGIKTVLPDKVLITVDERVPMAVINYMGANIVMDSTGYILEVRQQAGDIRCPVVTGVDVASFYVGQVVVSNDQSQIRSMQILIEEIFYQDASAEISEVNVSDSANVVIITYDGIKVKIGPAEDMPRKIQWLRGLLPEIRLMGYVGGTLDITNAEIPVYEKPNGTEVAIVNDAVQGDEEDASDTDQENLESVDAEGGDEEEEE